MASQITAGETEHSNKLEELCSTTYIYDLANKANLLKTRSQMNAAGVKNAIRFKDLRSFFLPFGFLLKNFQPIYSYFSPIASQGFSSCYLILNAIHIHKLHFISLITTAINLLYAL